jgi:hypothetical protein
MLSESKVASNDEVTMGNYRRYATMLVALFNASYL